MFESSWATKYDKVDNIVQLLKNRNNKLTEINPVIEEGANKQLHQYTKFDGWNLEYDKNGNTTQKGTQKFFYDYRNQMVRAKDLTGEVTFKYDALGRRIEKKTGSNTTRYYYDGNQVIEERDGSNNLLKQYVYGSGIDDVIRMDKYEGTLFESYYYHTNAIGSVTAITDGDGKLVERMSYDGFGQATIFDHFTDPENPVKADRSLIGNEYLFHAKLTLHTVGLTPVLELKVDIIGFKKF